MTEEQMQKVTWLNRAFYAYKKLGALLAQQDRLRTLAQSLSVSYEGNDKGKSSGSKNGTENALIKLADISRNIDSEVHTMLDVYTEIDNAIQQIDDDVSQAILKRRYLAFETMEQIAENMHYSERNIKYKHKQALDKFALDCIVLHPET